MAAEQNLEIKASPRKQGKHYSRTLRTQKLIPAVVYGEKVENFNFSIPLADAEKYIRHSYDNAIFVLKSDDKKLDGLQVLRKDFDIHPVTRLPIHLDFFAPDMTQTVRVEVELHFEGKPKGLQDGGVFNAVRRELEVECLPTAIPKYISVDISNLGLDDSLHVSDIKAPEGTRFITGDELTICTVAAVAEEPAATPEATEASAAGGAAAPKAE